MAGGVAVGIGSDQRVVVDVVRPSINSALKVARSHAHHAGAGVDGEQGRIVAAQGVGDRANGAAHGGDVRGVGGVFCNAAVGQAGDAQGGDFHHIGHVDCEGLALDQAAVGAGDVHAVAGLGLKVGAGGADKHQLAAPDGKAGRIGAAEAEHQARVAVAVWVVNSQCTHLDACANGGVFSEGVGR